MKSWNQTITCVKAPPWNPWANLLWPSAAECLPLPPAAWNPKANSGTKCFLGKTAHRKIDSATWHYVRSFNLVDPCLQWKLCWLLCPVQNYQAVADPDVIVQIIITKVICKMSNHDKMRNHGKMRIASSQEPTKLYTRIPSCVHMVLL